jgi:hypothetical protein
MCCLYFFLSYLILNSVGFQDFSEGGCQIFATVRLGDFDNVKQECQRLSIKLNMDCNCNESPMVWGGPRVGCEIDFSVVFLKPRTIVSDPWPFE